MGTGWGDCNRKLIELRFRRQELLNWLNQLLQLNVTKVEQCGTGAALCQVFDSIYGMSGILWRIGDEGLVSDKRNRRCSHAQGQV